MSPRTGTMAAEGEAEVEAPEVASEAQVDEPDVTEDPNEVLWTDGPTRGIVENWKAQFGKVYVTSFGPDENYVWRTLTRFEYRRLVKNIEQSVASGQVTQAEANLNNEEAICEVVMLWPQIQNRAEMAGVPAGVASIIAQEVMEASAFVASDVREL